MQFLFFQSRPQDTKQRSLKTLTTAEKRKEHGTEHVTETTKGKPLHLRTILEKDDPEGRSSTTYACQRKDNKWPHDIMKDPINDKHTINTYNSIRSMNDLLKLNPCQRYEAC